jgi:hypothetical protein
VRLEIVANHDQAIYRTELLQKLEAQEARANGQCTGR